jgi:ketosteroid isomerase-like protein
MRQKWVLAAIAAVFLSSSVSNGDPAGMLPPSITAKESSQALQEIETIIAGIVERWNAHDLQGYMNYAWNSPDFVEIEDGMIRRGWAENLAAYHDGFSDPSQMGRAETRLTHFELIKSDVAVAVTETIVYYPTAKNTTSDGTQIYRKFPEGWKIVFSEDVSTSP